MQRQLAEQAAAKADATGVEKIVGDFYATGMDEAKINAQGIEPLKSRLDAIAALDSQDKIADYLRTSAAKGENVLFGFGPEAGLQGFHDEHRLRRPRAAWACRTRPTTSTPTRRTSWPRTNTHVAKVLELSGVAAADAAKQAKDVIAFETRLAKASKSSEELSRDVALYYNPVTPADADKLAPNFPWTKFFESQGVAVPKMFSLAIPAFHQEVSKMLADVPAAQWQSYLRFHTVDGASPFLCRRVRAGELRLLRQDAARPEGTEGALEARARHDREPGRRGDGPAVREGRVPARIEGAHGGAGQEPAAPR